jgi:serine/threonine protein kinase
MEFLDGAILKHLIAGKPLEGETIIAWHLSLPAGWTPLTPGGVVHRDIKPANIFVTERGHAKALDFGLAKVAQTTVLPARLPRPTP